MSMNVVLLALTVISIPGLVRNLSKGLNAFEYPERQLCGSRPQAMTRAGPVCGARDPTGTFAQFLSVPYAKQPVGELRFKELQSVEPWTEPRDATKEGPICFQRDFFYGPIMADRPMSEECIHANVYVPLQRDGPLPVLVYVHGGGFAFGSGDPDAHGPQFLVRNGVIVITFNYRVGPFGFLSLNTSSVPGNMGLRDIVTLLRWVQDNVAAFGGNPRNVTLGGHSAGAASAHLLSLSSVTQDGKLFNRVVMLSGVGTRSFFTASPNYAQMIANMFLAKLNITASDPEEVHRQLIALPPERLQEAHRVVHDILGIMAFTPVVESAHEGVERILDDDPEILEAQGRGKHMPYLVGFTNAECQTFQPRLKAIDIVKRIKENAEIIVPLGVAYTTASEQLPNKIAEIEQEYFSKTLNLENFVNLCSDSFFIYPALKLAQMKAATGGTVFLYRFAYNADDSVYKMAHNLDPYVGAAHAEDLTFIFRANHILGNKTLTAMDSAMTKQMTTYITNFMRNSQPTTNYDYEEWLPMEKGVLQYKDITKREEFVPPSAYQKMIKFYDGLYGAWGV